MPISLLATTSQAYSVPLTIGLSGQIRNVVFAISSPYSAYCQVGKLDKSGSLYWDSNDIPLQPGQGAFDGVFGIRFRSFDPANATTVLAIAYFADDPQPIGFVPGTGVFSLSGAVKPGVNGNMTGDYKTSAIAATHADPIGGTWYLCDGSPLPASESALIALVGANTPDARGRMPVFQGTNAAVSAIGATEGATALINRRPQHRTSMNLSASGQLGYGGAAFAGGGTAAPGGGGTSPVTVTISGSIGTNNTNDALDTPAYIVPGNLFIHS